MKIVRIVLSMTIVLMLATGTAAAQTQTAQSAMVNVELDSTAFQIEGTITWTFHRGTANNPDLAMQAYTNTRTAGPTFLSCGGNATNCGAANAPLPATIAAAEPPPDGLPLQQHAQAERCTFFFGGNLTSTTYTQNATVKGQNGNGNWNYEWTYTIAPIVVAVPAHTAWTFEETGGSVDIGFAGFMASESFQKQSNRNKYSFTMIDDGVTRARNALATLQLSDGVGGWANVATGDLNNVDTNADTINDALAIEAATTDFSYFGNGGRFGNAAVFPALHSTGGKSANTVTNILNGTSDGSPADNFAGNNNDLAAGAVHLAPFEGAFADVSTAGAYRVLISAVLKSNSGSADFGFSVSSSQTVIGGCTQP